MHFDGFAFQYSYIKIFTTLFIFSYYTTEVILKYNEINQI